MKCITPTLAWGYFCEYGSAVQNHLFKGGQVAAYLPLLVSV
ncbi:hypothetical protein ACNTOD_003677 [Vibrio navarrensis]